MHSPTTTFILVTLHHSIALLKSIAKHSILAAATIAAGAATTTTIAFLLALGL